MPFLRAGLSGRTSPNPRHLAVQVADWRAHGEIVYVQQCGWLAGCDWLSVVYNKNEYTSISTMYFMAA